MRISDWSSDVCSSDLRAYPPIMPVWGGPDERKFASRAYTAVRDRRPVQSLPTGALHMANVLVLYYSAYGHIEAMAQAVAEGVRDAGAKVDIKRVPELVPVQVAKASHYTLDQAAQNAKIEYLKKYCDNKIGTGDGERRERGKR